ncbi:YceI family protein [Streptomyces sp. HUAS 31]|uniref:YceI family protein n=1 Tax=Streptomyces sp. HUAS 31 TaxID=3020055 RepID=UPI002305358E|nr:YceI family protein [Streptomyces sp. HUAS 31]WCD94226.1 YceI family protein [Streptomyces sp. HUAS 31]
MTSGTGSQSRSVQPAGGIAIYLIDPDDSSVTLRARSRASTGIRGVFKHVAGTLTLDRERPERTAFAVYATASSLDTGSEERDARLCGAAFLDARRHPLVSFWSFSAEVQDAGLFRLVGNLSLRGITHPLVVDAARRERAPGPQGAERVAVAGRSILKRSEWSPLRSPGVEASGWFAGDDVELLFEVSAIKQQPIRWWP